MLNAALSILLQNAFRYTRPRSNVWLDVVNVGNRILIEVADECAGLGVHDVHRAARRITGLIHVNRAACEGA